MMQNNPVSQNALVAYKYCKWLTFAAVFFGLLFVLQISVQCYNHLFVPGYTEWKVSVATLQVTMLVLYWLLSIVLLALQSIFFVDLLKGLKNGTIFNPACVKWLYSWGIAYFVFDFVLSNVAGWGVHGEFNALAIEPSLFVVPLIVFTFAVLFRLAAKVSEDSNLTI